MLKTVKNLMITSLITSLFFTFSDIHADDVDHLSLAAILIQDNHFAKAKGVLDKAEKSLKEANFEKFYFLTGLLNLKQEQFKISYKSFQKALTYTEKPETIQLYLAQASFGLEDYDKVVYHISLAPTLVKEFPAIHILLAKSYWKQGFETKAWKALNEAIKAHPTEKSFLAFKIEFLIEQGLFQVATQECEALLNSKSLEPEHLIKTAHLLKSKGQNDVAKTILEQGLLVYSNHTDLKIELAHSYLSETKFILAAHLFEQIAVAEPKYLKETAELYRRAGRFTTAMYLTSQIADKKEKLKQKLAIHLDLEQYELIASMETELFVNNLLADDDIRYALAYSLYELNDYTKSESHLKKIYQPKLFDKANQLRLTMAQCKEKPLTCI